MMSEAQVGQSKDKESNAMNAQTTPSDQQAGNPRTFVIGNGPLFDGGGRFFEKGALRIEGDRVAALGDLDQVLSPGLPFIDVEGRLILPGLVNLHHHFYSALAVGLRPTGPITDFRSNLAHFWWPLDSALGSHEVEVSTRLTLVECLKHGVTTVFDHHASPFCAQGILDKIAVCVEEAGLNAVLALEVSDRNGEALRDASLEENLRFLGQRGEHRHVRGVMGLHANFTLSEISLERVAAALPEGEGVHIHCGEAAEDATFCRDAGYAGPVERLDRSGLLNHRTILAHGVHLTPGELDTIQHSEAFLVHNPESNCKNAVGELSAKASGYGLGTDGMTSSMLGTLRFAFLRRRGLSPDPEYSPDAVLRALFTVNARAASLYLDDVVGILSPGARADVAVFDYIPLTPIDEGNLAGHLIFGAHAARAHYVLGSGAVLLWKGKPITLREDEIRGEAAALAPQLFARIARSSS